MDKLIQFFREAFRQFHQLHRNGYASFLTKRKTQSWWVIGISVSIGLMMLMWLSSIRSEQHKWATSHPVLVATVDLESGAALGPHNTEVISIPLAIVPADAFDALPENGVTRLAVRARTPLTSSLVATDTDAISVPEGWRIVALPRSLPAPPLVIGDVVDVVGGSGVIAQAARVASVDPLTVAVPADAVATVATASRLGEISLVVSR